jgi:alanine racemase
MTSFRNTWADINLDHLKLNIEILNKTSGKSIFSVIKANAYGHGDIEIARFLESLDVSYLCVSSLDEAIHLRRNGIKMPVMVLGYTETDYLDVAIEYSVTCVVPSIEWLKVAVSKCPSVGQLVLHIKIDSGMNRVGIKTIKEFDEVIKIVNENKLKIEGICTHLSSSNVRDGHLTKQQIERFMEFLRHSTLNFRWVHLENSDAALASHDCNELCNAVRCGIAMYGYSTYDDRLKPVLSLRCGINQLKKLFVGDKVSYSATYTASRPETVAILPIGYADGLDRKLQGYHFTINHNPCEVVGRICMDLTIIRVPDDTDLSDIVDVINENSNAARMAEYLDTISYEILTSISPRITRRYWYQGKLVKITNERFD